MDGMGSSSSSSSPQNIVYNVEKWLHSLELKDGYAFNGEVGKWLNEMVPIPVSVASEMYSIFCLHKIRSSALTILFCTEFLL
uniref:Uncharacterized protein n=1 Tax=Rhizophora mucronata TaxID=61149 RepID=A0A2P2JFC9_RHIMU